ncbi:FAD-dependent oxidoreductase [Pedobacter sp.]|uniref:FAD-dependent oxidoreductase n=1 Tax=Pedobacter sp. TaxID=1411316 RepID=UPI003C34ECD1
MRQYLDMKNKKNQRDGKTISIWQRPMMQPPFSKDILNSVYDAIIVGGGITGLTTAFNLQRAGKKCILVEAKNLGFGTSGGTSAHLNTFFDSSYPEIDSNFGKEASKAMATASKRMIKTIQANIDELNIEADFEYKSGFLFSQNEKETQELDKILSSSKAAGVLVEESGDNGVPVRFLKAIEFSNQAQFHPLKYIDGLARGFLSLGGRILENTFIEEVKESHGLHYASGGAMEIQGRKLIWATHIPPGINLLSLRNAPYRSYVLAVKLNNETYPDCLSYDMQEPYHYFRSHEIDGQKYMIAGGEDHKTGHEDPEEAFKALEQYIKANFDVLSVDYKWSSQYYVPVDGLPYIGLLPGAAGDTYVATGFNGNGMILGSLAGEILSDLILGRDNDLSDLLSPSRLKPLSGLSEFVKENADVAYHFVADRFGSELLAALKSLPIGEGKIVKFQGERLAVHKDAHGKVRALSPVCTHAGCIVNWNSVEQSWDCPCHGGRFDIDGSVITGPPKTPLKKIEVPHR